MFLTGDDYLEKFKVILKEIIINSEREDEKAKKILRDIKREEED